MFDKFKINSTILIASITILAFEIHFIRLMAIKEWQNYTSMIISMALLGYGTSGTLITLFNYKINKNIDILNLFFSIIYFFSVLISIVLYCMIPFNPFEVLWNFKQIFFLFLHFIILILPFISGSFLIGIHFLGKSKTSFIYFLNLLGSGLGTLLSLILLNFFHPYHSLLIIISLIAILSFIILLSDYTKNKRIISIIILIIILISPIIFDIIVKKRGLLEPGEFKGISYRLILPNSKIISEKYSPLGVVQVVEAEGLREVNGLSYNFKGKIPIQKGIFFDADLMSPVSPFKNDLTEVEFVKHTSSALPFYIFENKKIKNVLIIGTGGGEGILRALSYNSEKIDGIEINKNVIEIMKNELSIFSGNIYNKKNINIMNKDAREFIRKTEKMYDIIEISLLDSLNSAASGIYSLNENYIYTIESFEKFYNTLSDKGILAITRWIKEPPRDSLKLFALIVEMLKKNKIKDFEKKIAFIRSCNTATLCLSKGNIDSDIIRNFCDMNSFDLVYIFNMNENESNRYFKMQNPVFYNSCQKMISRESKMFMDQYPFYLKPPTDNSPFYFNFFKFKTLKMIIDTKTKMIPFAEWGYVILIILLMPIIMMSFILIIIPLFFLNKKNNSNFSGLFNFYTFTFFFFIGVGFFFIEMSLIQKFVLFLCHPTYSLSITISSILIFSGIGSFFSNKISKIYKINVFFIIFIIIIIYILFLDKVMNLLIAKEIHIKIIISIILLGIPGFFMGMPFPSTLSIIKNKYDYLVSWAWGINGFASVISSLLAVIFAIMIGFKNVLFIAGFLYILAGFIFWRIQRISRQQ